MKINDLTGRRFGKLVVASRSESRNGRAFWLCLCDCGNTTKVSGSNLLSGHTSSCGCLAVKHGFARKERLYNIWVGMRQRCRDKNIKDYPNYGGKGIRVCDEWNDYPTFRNWAIASGYSDGLTIDRINGNGNYEPHNCRWATYREQNNNLKSNTRIQYREEVKTAKEWADEFGINYGTFKSRLRYGWSMERIEKTPIQQHRRNRGDTV